MAACVQIKAKLIDALAGLDYIFNGDQNYCIPSTANISFKGVDAEALFLAMKNDYAFSNGSACNSGSHEPSYVLTAMGLPEERILLDPGIGFGKTLDHNLALLRAIPRFLSLGRPLLIGLSMKSLFQQLLGLELNERGLPTQVASALLFSRGVFWHRVHHVAATRTSLLLTQAMQTEL